MIRMAWITSGYIPSPGRMAVIAGTTFTQLVRMKVFLFLGLFAVALLALSSFRLSAVLGPETGGINELVLLKTPPTAPCGCSASFSAWRPRP